MLSIYYKAILSLLIKGDMLTFTYLKHISTQTNISNRESKTFWVLIHIEQETNSGNKALQYI